MLIVYLYLLIKCKLNEQKKNLNQYLVWPSFDFKTSVLLGTPWVFRPIKSLNLSIIKAFDTYGFFLILVCFINISSYVSMLCTMRTINRSVYNVFNDIFFKLFLICRLAGGPPDLHCCLLHQKLQVNIDSKSTHSEFEP